MGTDILKNSIFNNVRCVVLEKNVLKSLLFWYFILWLQFMPLCKKTTIPPAVINVLFFEVKIISFPVVINILTL